MATALRFAQIARAASLLCLAGCVAGAQPATQPPATRAPAGGSIAAPSDQRPFRLVNTPQAWGGVGVCYGPHRDGQFPEGPSPTEAQIREDLHIMARHWSMLRVYAARGSAEIVCRLIRAEKLPLKVLVGAWIAQESIPNADGTPGPVIAPIAAANQAEVAAAVRLANEFPDVVVALNIGNEALVSWSAHRVAPSVVKGYLRQARAATTVPVSTCDTELYWTQPESRDIASECDYLALHAYAMWNGQSLTDSFAWTRDRIAAVHAMHPDLPIVITEIGWATDKGTTGDQARLITAVPNERDQEIFFRALRDWAIEHRQPYFFFEAFDENWKGGPEPSEVEKHWGVYNADRTPKLLFRPHPGAPAPFPPDAAPAKK
ncbi:MAG: glycosyl hydrolase family 17 protein [Planctomycetota bacterium]|nr:glycosyl hydrolase family 17 protein [Planctomycetota bacterium]